MKIGKNPAGIPSRRSKTSTSIPPALLPQDKPNLHLRSYAAHLDAGYGEPHTKPAGDLRRASHLMLRKEP